MIEVVYIVAGDYGFKNTIYGVYTNMVEAEQRRLEVALKLEETAPNKDALEELIEEKGFDYFMTTVVKIYAVRLDAPTDIVFLEE